MPRTKLNSRSLKILAMMLIIAVASPVFAGDQDFLLINETGVDIFYVYISPSNVESWEEDVLGVDVLEDGDDVEIQFHRSERAQMWDLMVMDEDENSIVWERLNLFEIYAVTLYYDHDTGEAWAETESI